jgi:uncharacterized protein (DUF1697 family)
MNTYIALFRGINVGGKNILPMKEIVGILEEMGCEKVRTYIQSGNVVFKSKKRHTNTMGDEISSQVLKRYGFEPKVLLLDIAELQDAIKHNPFNTEDGKALHFFFLNSHPKNPDLEKLMAFKLKSEEFKLIKKIFYLYAPERIGHSKLAAKVEQNMGVPVTARNWNTIRKLISIAEE